MACDDPAFTIGPLTWRDLPAALAIQSDVYPAFLVEDEAAFASRINLQASYCLAARRKDELLGYLLAHGWKHRSPPAAGTILKDEVPSEVLFLHDLAVACSGRGLRVGQALVRRVFELAARDGLGTAELVAVEGAADYWRRLGFVSEPVSAELQAKVGTYGALARWMTRAIPPGR